MATGLFNRPADTKQPFECGHRQPVKDGARSAWCPICLDRVPVQSN